MRDGAQLNYDEVLNYLDAAPANIFFKDAECRYSFVSEVCSLVNGDDIIGKTDLEVQKFPELGRQFFEDDKKILATGEGSSYISEFPLPAGSVYYEVRKEPVFKDGAIAGIVGVVSEVTELVKMENELKELAYHDGLTGLYNRNFLDARGRKDVTDDDFPVSLIVADCNTLKQVNDSLGHEYGDLVLRKIAGVFRDVVPERCVPVRTGGDEFLVFCPRLTADEAKALIEDLKRALAEKSDRILDLSVAFGSYTVEDDSLSFSDAFALADQAMYENKRASRGDDTLAQ